MSRAAVHERLGRYEAALADYNRAIMHDPCAAVSLNARRATCHEALQSDVSCSASGKRPSSKANECADLIKRVMGALCMRRGLLRERMGQVREASADLHAACLLEPGNAAFLRNRGVNHRANGDFAAALVDLDEVLRLEPDDAAALANRGSVHLTAFSCSVHAPSSTAFTLHIFCGES